METPKYDIDEIKTDNVLNTFETLLKKRFDQENGPLWFVRYINLEDDSWQTHYPHFVPIEENEDKPHKFMIIFGFCHNFSDGTTNTKFCEVFLKVMNDLLLKKEIDMKVEAKLVEPYHDRLADQMKFTNTLKSHLWLVYVFFYRIFSILACTFIFFRKFTDHYIQPRDREAYTRIIPGELDEKTTARLIQKCKDEKATLNSAFTAAANLALYRMILLHNESLKKISFGGIHTINMRRYWTKEESEDSCGLHISTIDVHIPTTIDDMNDTWTYARKIQERMKYELNDSKRSNSTASLSTKVPAFPLSERLL